MVTPSFSIVHHEQVMGSLKATGSQDPDVLFAAKQALLEPVKPLKFIGLWAYVMGVILCILILTAILGIPLIFFGWWVRKRASQNIETIESAYAEYLRSLGHKPATAA